MADFRYMAEDADGRPVAGRIEADSADEARRLLEERGLRVETIALTDSTVGSAPGRREQDRALSAAEAERLAEHVAQLSGANLPLAMGLRAAGDESDSRSLADALYCLADQIEQGRPLEDALVSSAGRLPQYMSGVIAASARTGHLGLALSELAEHRRAARELRRDCLAGLAYPLVIACVGALLFIAVITVLGGTFEKIFLDFGMQLPMITGLFLWWHHVGIWLLAGGVAAIAAVLFLIRLRLSKAAWHRLLETLPVFGPISHWSGLMEWYSLLGVLLRYRIPLPESLRLCADGLSNASIARLSLAAAEGVSRGRTLSQTMASMRPLPASLSPVIRWGEETGNLVEALGTAREMLEDRVRTWGRGLQMILPPLLFLAIGCVVLFIVLALFMPLISLISHLS